MAKDFNVIYKESKAAVYSSPVNALFLLTRAVPGVEFSPVLAPNGGTTITATSKYNIQRRMRPDVKAVANPNTGGTADALAVLDSFAKTD